MRIRVDIVQAHPHAELCQCRHQIGHPGLHRASADKVELVAHVDAVGAGVLRDDEDLAHALFDQVLGLAHDLADRPRNEIAAHRRNDAEAATMVAAFGDLQIRVVARRELDAGRRHQVGVRIVRLRQVPVHVVEHLGRRMGSRDGEHLRVHLGDEILATVAARTEAARDDHLAVFRQRFTDGVERFLHRRVDEAAGVDDDEVSPLIGRAGGVALGAQLRQDQFRIDQRLWAAQRHEAHRRRGGLGSASGSGRARPPRGLRGGHRRSRLLTSSRPGSPGSP